MHKIETMFPNGLAVRVRTGDKVDGKHVTAKVAVKPGEWSAEFMALVVEAGARAVVAEKLNTAPTEKGVKLAEAKVLFAQADRGEMPAACVRVRGAGAASADPILVEAIKLARADLMVFAKVKNMVAAAEHKDIGKFFTVSASGAVSDKVEAFEAFIAKNDEKKRYTERAKAIVDARGGAEEELAIEL